MNENDNQTIGRLRYTLLCIGVLAQLITVCMTWPLWQIRSGTMPNLPVFAVPEFNFGFLVVVSTALVLLIPKSGIWINLAVLIVASLFDQVRTQPQILANWILMFAVVAPYGSLVVRLFLASLWFWAGLHKVLSPDWFTGISWGLMQESDLNPELTHLMFAYLVPISEVGLGLLAWFKPRWAAVCCPLLHVGITIFLTPLFRDWNYSVIPWNLATAIIGCWILFDVSAKQQGERARGQRIKTWQYCFLALFMIAPAGFYWGLLDHGYSHVLYSGNIPRGIVTKLDGSNHEIQGWGALAVPFPNERRLLKAYFCQTAKVGEKLHVSEPRSSLDDQFFVLTGSGPSAISAEEFYQESSEGVIGIGADVDRSVFVLAQAQARMLKRDEKAMIYAIEISPQAFSSELMAHLPNLPNLEQVQLSGTAVTDEDLKHLLTLQRLEAISLNHTAITAQGIETLGSIPTLSLIQHDQD